MNLTGNYRVSDNKIHVSNQFVSVKDDMIPQSNGITRQSNSYWLYKFSKSSYHDYYGSGQYFDVNWLEINMYPKDKGVLNKYVKYTKPFKR